MKRDVLLRRLEYHQVELAAPSPIDPSALEDARLIVKSVRREGDAALRRFAEKYGERSPGQPLVLGSQEMRRALEATDQGDRELLERAADRIRTFAQAQRNSIAPLRVNIPGGVAGHTVEPVHDAGCYAPAGRYPLPSSVLMTAITARIAGCRRVVVASPGAHPLNLAAAAVAGADEFLALGGAHAIAALAYGTETFARCDVIAGPGNAWVTAAKHLVSASVGIDMLAGPSELLVIADDTADPARIAADLLAQAEHDVRAVPMLITTDPGLCDRVDDELFRQLADLPTAPTARQSLKNGFAVYHPEIDNCVALSDRLAPEHLQIMTRQARDVAARIANAGAIFVGSASAEVFGDYGAGPNHTLPTGGTARFQAGLSVTHFLRLRTFIDIEASEASRTIRDDAVRLAEMEGLAGHARAALHRSIR